MYYGVVCCNKGERALGHYAGTAHGRSFSYQPDKWARPKRTLDEIVAEAAARPIREAARVVSKSIENPGWMSLKVGDRVTSPYWGEGVVRTITRRGFRGNVEVSGLGFCNSRVLFKEE